MLTLTSTTLKTKTRKTPSNNRAVTIHGIQESRSVGLNPMARAGKGSNMRNVMYKQRAYSVAELLLALSEMVEMTERDADTLHLDNVDMVTLTEVTLTDGSKVYDVSLDDVGPDLSLPTR